MNQTTRYVVNQKTNHPNNYEYYCDDVQDASHFFYV